MCYNDITTTIHYGEEIMLSDIEIAESAQLIDIREEAAKLGLPEIEIELYGY